MLKLIRRYYGELCDKEKLINKENYDEDITMQSMNKKEIMKEFKNQMTKDIKNGYVADKQCNFKEEVRLFLGEQENWNNYIEMFILEDNTDIQDLQTELYNMATQTESMTGEEMAKKMLGLEDKYNIPFYELQNKLAENIIVNTILNYRGSRTIHNNTFINIIDYLEQKFNCEIDIVDLTVRFNVI